MANRKAEGSGGGVAGEEGYAICFVHCSLPKGVVAPIWGLREGVLVCERVSSKPLVPFSVPFLCPFEESSSSCVLFLVGRRLDSVQQGAWGDLAGCKGLEADCGVLSLFPAYWGPC